MKDLNEVAKKVLDLDAIIPHNDWDCVYREDGSVAVISPGWGPIAEIGGQSMGAREREMVGDLIAWSRELLPLFAKEYLEREETIQRNNDRSDKIANDALDVLIERDQLRAEVERLKEEHGLELRRWQDAIRDKIMDHVPNANIDGAGCDSGDPLDLTLAEISQGFNAMKESFDVLNCPTPKHIDCDCSDCRPWTT